ncbi:MAG: type II toxin-antitoxin system prevent-host-death family antitoxin [bacterium]|nr:type II toxin-antitoxin system prevent-host-death family antitoxin [bacterium]
MSDFVTVSEGRAKLPQLVKQLASDGGQVVVTVHGKPKVMMMNYDDYMEILDMYAFGITPQVLQESLDSGISTMTLEDLKKEHGLED